MDLINITPKVLLTDAIKSIDPDCALFDHPLIKKAGHYIGGDLDMWTWVNLEQFTEDDNRNKLLSKNPKAKYAR